MPHLYEIIQQNVATWREAGYPCDYSAMAELLEYAVLPETGSLRTEQQKYGKFFLHQPAQAQVKDDLVKGRYELPAPEGETTVAVKIIDMLGEERLVTNVGDGARA